MKINNCWYRQTTFGLLERNKKKGWRRQVFILTECFYLVSFLHWNSCHHWTIWTSGLGTRNPSTKIEMSCSLRCTADNVSKHVISFPSIIWVQWRQPYKPCGLHFCFWRLSKKCHRSSNCYSTYRIIIVHHILRATKRAIVKKYRKIILFCFCISSLSLF
jgi:hypothetical protein